MTQEELDILREKLPTGFGETLKNRTGFSRQYVYMVLLGTRENSEIIDAAIALSKENIERESNQKNLIQTL